MWFAQVASKDATPTGPVHKSRGDTIVELNMCWMVCISISQRGQYDEVCVFASTLCKYDLRKCVL